MAPTAGFRGSPPPTLVTSGPYESESRCLDEIAGALAEFFDLRPARVRELLREEYDHPGVGVAAAWRDASPERAEEVTRFYRETTSYVFDLAADNCRERRRVFWAVVLERLRRVGGKDVLAYGDGIGTDSIDLARLGYKVTYFDLPGVTSEFARFRFSREGLADSITFVDQPGKLSAAAFDVILCVEVLEHLPDPVGAMRHFYSLLHENGVVLLTESFESIGPEYPSHLESNYRYAGRTHQLMESIGFANTFINPSPINRPMEFRKVPPGPVGAFLRAWGRVGRAARTRARRLRSAVRSGDDEGRPAPPILDICQDQLAGWTP
jgi:SAM-dependent methyltransferase